MRIITSRRLREYAKAFPGAAVALVRWELVTLAARWGTLVDVRHVFPHADQVTVRSGRTVVIFNISGNKFRLITAIHFDKQRVYILLCLPHAEYSRDDWKKLL